MPADGEVLGIITKSIFGVEDHGFVGLILTVQALHDGATIALHGEDALKFVKDNEVWDTTKLVGKPIVVRWDRNMMSYVRMFK